MLKAEKFKYNPVLEGFNASQPETDYGHLSVEVDTSTCDFKDNNSLNAILVNNEAITGDWDIGNFQKKDGINDEKTRFGVNVRDYFNGDEMKSKAEIADTKEGALHAPTGGQHKPIEVCQTYYSSSDVYFTGNMQPYFDIFQPMFGFDMKKIHQLKGDGTEEAKLINAVDDTNKCDAYLINVVKQPNAREYIDHIASKVGATKQSEWINRSDVPVIFWNRQPTNDQGEVSTDVMNNEYFKYTYYVGFGAEAGGEIQGDMVAEWLNEAYIQNA